MNLERTTRTRIMEGKRIHWLFPEITSIADFVDDVWLPQLNLLPPEADHQPYRGARSISSRRDYFYLDNYTPAGRWMPVYVRANSRVGKGIKARCTDNEIGGYRVIKGAWPGPYALLMASDQYHIAHVYVSLIDYPEYQDWLKAVYHRELVRSEEAA